MAHVSITEKVVSILQAYPVKRAGLFGSYARENYNADSDIDIMVEFEEGVPLFENFYDLWDQLEVATALKVDLVQYAEVFDNRHKLLQKNMLQDLRWIYES